MIDGPRTLERFRSFFTEGDPAACWEWDGARDWHGYGKFTMPSPLHEGSQNRSAFAHRVAYVTFIGPVPEGLELDHLCRNPACVNPEHLEPVTHQENVRRGAKGGLVTECPQGHAYDEANTYVPRSNGRRYCRACHRIRESERRARARAA